MGLNHVYKGEVDKEQKTDYLHRRCLMCLILMLSFSMTRAQDTVRMQYGGYPVFARIENGDTIIISNLEEATIKPRDQFESKRDLRQYNRLIYNVKKVYPYAKLAGELYREIENTLYSLDTEKERKDYLSKVEKEILANYQEDLKKLTVTQGRILIKLIDRETQHTSYELVKDLRGSFQAVFWQAIARLFGSNLKTNFDAEGEDMLIDEIMILIDFGMV